MPRSSSLYTLSTTAAISYHGLTARSHDLRLTARRRRHVSMPYTHC